MMLASFRVLELQYVHTPVNGPFAAEQSRGSKMAHWDMLKKATKFEFSLFDMSQCVICSLVWQFSYHMIAQLQMTHLASWTG